MRLFFAFELPADTRAALGRLTSADERSDYRWVDPALLHLTLVFLGNQSADRVDAILAIGRAAAAASTCGRLRLSEPGSFGRLKTPRVLWIGLAGDLAGLHAVYARLVAGLREGGVDFAEEQDFRPHITLARRRASARGGAPPDWPPTQAPVLSAFQPRHLTLFESRLSPRGPSYVRLAELLLDGSPTAG